MLGHRHIFTSCPSWRWTYFSFTFELQGFYSLSLFLKKSKKIYASSAILIGWRSALTYYFCAILALHWSVRQNDPQNVHPSVQCSEHQGLLEVVWKLEWVRVRLDYIHVMCSWILMGGGVCCRAEVHLEKLKTFVDCWGYSWNKGVCLSQLRLFALEWVVGVEGTKANKPLLCRRFLEESE